jgi:DnaJ-class molecular chaperone
MMEDNIPCPECSWTDYHGKIEKEVFMRYGGTLAAWVNCDHCNGTGEVEREDT